MNTYLIIILVYFALVNGLAIFTVRKAGRSSSEYLIAGRNMGMVAVAMVVAAEWLGGLSTIGVSERAFTTGTLEPVLYNLSTSLGMIIIGFTVAAHYRRHGVHTVGEMLGKLFGEKVRKISSLAFLVAYIILGYVQLQTCAGVIAPLFSMQWPAAVMVSAGIITLYTYLGGMHALALTGIIHMFARYLGTGIALWVGLDKLGGLEPLTQQLLASGSPQGLYNPFSNSLSAGFSLLLGGVLGGMAAQASIQPIFAAKDVKTAKRAAILSGFLIAPFGLLTGMLGLMARSGHFIDPATVINPKMALTLLLTEPSFIHPFWGGIALAGILAAIFSTAGPVNFAIVTIAAKDIYQGWYHKNADDGHLLKTARRMVIAVNLVLIPPALLFHQGVLEAAYASYAIRSAGAIVLVLGIYFRKYISIRGAVLAFAAAVAAVLYNITTPYTGLPSADTTYLTLLAALSGIFAGTFFRKNPFS